MRRASTARLSRRSTWGTSCAKRTCQRVAARSSFAGGLGSILGGFLAPRLGPVLTIVGAFLLTLFPLLAVIASEPGTALYFAVIVLAGILIFVPVPALIIIAQEFVPGAPATASGMVLGLGWALAGIGYVVLGRVQETVG